MTNTTSDPQNIIVFGDWHGNTQFALKALRFSYVDDFADIYLHTGDFGIWPETISKKSNSYISLLEKELKSQDRELWFIDGNHENFEILDNLEKDSRGLGIVSPHIYHIPRGHRWEWNETTFLGLGGAVSIDRDLRRNFIDYFPAEEIREQDVKLALNGGPVDILLTHEAPTEAKPVPYKDFGGSINRDVRRSTNAILELIQGLTPRLNIHGHYHIDKVTAIDIKGADGKEHDCKVIALSNDAALTHEALYKNKCQIDLV